MGPRRQAWWVLPFLIRAALNGVSAFSPRLGRLLSQFPRVPVLYAVPHKDVYDMFVSGFGLVVNVAVGVRQGILSFGDDDARRLAALNQAVDFVQNSTMPLKAGLQGGKLVQRTCFREFAITVDLARRHEQNFALLVYGPRGVGKTSVVTAALHGTKGILPIAYSGDGRDFESFLEATVLQLSWLPSQASEAMPGNRLRAIMAFYKEVHKCRPVVVVEVNAKIGPTALGDLLLSAKQLGFEEELITFVFVLSASRSALGLTIGMHELRVEGYRAPDFSRSDAVTYLSKNLGPFGHLATYVVEQVGTRAVDLVAVCKRCEGASSEEVCKERVGVYRMTGILEAHAALDGFLHIAQANEGYSSQESMALFEHLLNGTTQQHDLDARAAFGFKGQAKLLAALAEYHAFVVDAFDRSLRMQSHFMAIAIREYLQRTGRS